MSSSIPRLLDEVENPKWQADGLCQQADPALFFQNGTSAAKKLCALCPVTEQCLDWILDIESSQGLQYGVYGGKAAGERSRMRRCKAKGCKNPQLPTQSSFCSETCRVRHEKQLSREYKDKQVNVHYDYPIKGKVHHA